MDSVRDNLLEAVYDAFGTTVAGEGGSEVRCRLKIVRPANAVIRAAIPFPITRIWEVIPRNQT